MIRLISALIAFGLAGGIFFLYTSPAYSNAQAASAKVAQYNDALDKAAQLQQLKQSLLSKYNAFNPNDISRLEELLPDSVDNIGLILDLDSMAGRYGLPLENVDVSSTPDQTSSSPSAVGGNSSSSLYQSLTIQFSTEGSYANFVQFMTDLESSLRLVDLVSLTITATGSNSSVTTAPSGSSAQSAQSAHIYTYDITLRTYWLK